MSALKEISTQIKSQLQTIITSWSAKRGFPEKVNNLNSYVNSNKKRSLSFAFGIVFFLFLVTILVSLRQCYFAHEAPLSSLSNIEDISPLIEGKQRIEEIKQQHISNERTILFEGKHLKYELDSLMGISLKSHQDSLDIVRKHKQLELIVNYLNEKD